MNRAQVRRRGAAALEAEARALAPAQLLGAGGEDQQIAGATLDSSPSDAPHATDAAEITRVGYAPIVRVDTARREIELCATSEAVDSYGTVFDYDASKAAFARWIGNVREMHERRAVGRRVAVRCDDAARRIFVRVRISAGARDTWEKIGDGTLRGASIGASNVVWTFQTRRVAGRDQVVQVASAYDLVELSLVDNPSNPDALGITIVRATEPVAALLAELEDEGTEGAGPRGGNGSAEDAEDRRERREGERFTTEETEGREEQREEERGATDDAEARGGQGDTVVKGGADHLAAGGLRRDERGGSAERTQGPFSDNAAGAPDMGVPSRALAPEPTAAAMPAAGNARERFHAAARGVLLGCGCGLCEAALAALGSLVDADERGSGMAATREAGMARAVAAGLAAEARQVERMEASVRALDEALRETLGGMGATLDTALGDLRARLERIEAQPLPGGPALRAVEKSHALGASPPASPTSGTDPATPAEQYRALEALAGKLSDPQAQIAVAAELIRLRAREAR